MQNSTPSVLAVLVVKDGAAWLRQVLASLARQTYPRLAVLAVDNGSTDDSVDLLERTLGSRRVLRAGRNLGFPAAVARALSVPAAEQADYVLLMHDDTLLGPQAVQRMVDAARGTSSVGVVGPKVLDWEEPRVLREVGFASDRFGYPYSPVEEGEIDQGQYDAPREVLFVSSAAMLVSREAWKRAGLPDDRLQSAHGDLDFCWRVRLAGLRVLVATEAVALHRMAGELGERPEGIRGGDRYLSERAGLLSLLKNYRLLTLLWVLPLYAVQGLLRVIIQLVSRHFDRAAQVVRAWGWNLLHLSGTLGRRRRAQRARRVRDRDITSFMAPAGTRLRRWALQASSVLVIGEGMEEEDEAAPLRRQVRSVLAAHPVAVGLGVAVLVTLFAFRGVLFVPSIEGGALPVFPDRAWDFFREFASGWRSTGFGGTGGASPALVPLGAASAILAGEPRILARLIVALAPLAAGITSYRALIGLGASRFGAVTAAACYGLSALTLWAASEGALGVIALVVGLPWIAVRLWRTLDGPGPSEPFRWMVGVAMGVALIGAFFPAVWVAMALVVVPVVLVPGPETRTARGVALALGAGALAAVLLFPFVRELVAAGGGASVEGAARADLAALLRLSPGPAPGAWTPAFFLPLAGVVAFALVGEERRAWAWRALLIAAAGGPLAWLAAAGHLPPLVANPAAYLAPAALALCVLVGLAVGAVVAEMRRAAFGSRQVAAAALGALLALGLLLQAGQAVTGRWGVGEARIPPAWPVVVTAEPDLPFRVLWLGTPGAGAFPPPGGQPQGTVSAGAASVSYAVTGRGGRSVLAVGLPSSGRVYERLEESLAAVLSGRIRHGGALLAPFGIRYVVARSDGLPPHAAGRLAEQLDIDHIQQAGGLVIYRTAGVLPRAAALPGEEALEAARAPDLLAPLAVEPDEAVALRRNADGWEGTVRAGDSLVLVGVEEDPAWRLAAGGAPVRPFAAFGWALGFAPPDQGSATVVFEGQGRRTIEVTALALLWGAALWVVRRRPRPDQRPAHARTRSPGRRAPERVPAGGGGRQ